MGNPITNELPPSLDNFLQDMCQMYAKEMNYSSVAKFAEKATTEDIKALRKLYRKAKEAAEVDDEEDMQNIADEVEKLVLRKDSIKESFEDDCGEEEDPLAAEKEGNPYIVGNCSICGAHGTDTVENFLKKYGFEDIDYSCDILDIDPLEEVCEECFKSWLPELNDRTYSEYNDLGIDTRTGELFGEPFDESVKNKANLKESCAYNIIQKVIKDDVLPSTGYTETNEGIEATFSIKEITDYTGLDDPLEAVEALFKGLGYTGTVDQIANEEEFITVEFPYTSENLKESADSEDGLSDYQKDVIKDMVQADFECGHTMDYEEALDGMEEDEDLGSVAEDAANYYVELVQMGPAGFYEEFKDELDFDPDFVAEYGDPEDDEEEDDLTESKKNTKKALTESEEDEMWQAYNTWFDDCDAAYNRHEINDEFMADYNAFEQAYKTASGNSDVEYGSLKDIYDPWYESHAPHYDLSHADHWEAGWKFGKGLM